MLDAFLTNCQLADGRVVDIGIADGKIAIVGEGAAPASSNSAPALDIGGDLVLPGLICAPPAATNGRSCCVFVLSRKNPGAERVQAPGHSEIALPLPRPSPTEDC